MEMMCLGIKGFKGLISVLLKNKQIQASNYLHCVLSDSTGDPPNLEVIPCCLPIPQSRKRHHGVCHMLRLESLMGSM